MQRAFNINYLKCLFSFPNELKLHPRTHQISNKYLEAKFRGCFIQVSQVNLVNLKLKDRTVVFINTHRKFGHKFTNLEASQQNRREKKRFKRGHFPHWVKPAICVNEKEKKTNLSCFWLVSVNTKCKDFLVLFEFLLIGVSCQIYTLFMMAKWMPFHPLSTTTQLSFFFTETKLLN